MGDKKIKLNLEFPESVFKIMKQRKNREARKRKMKDMTWETFIQIKTLC